MRKTNVVLAVPVLIGALTWAGSAVALNPQPEPPAQHVKHVQPHNTQFESTDLCLAARAVAADKKLAERERTRLLNKAVLACSQKGVPLDLQPQPPG